MPPKRQRANFKSIGPQRLIIACAVVLSLVVAGSAGLVVYNLRTQILSENGRALSNSALILAKQIEQIFGTVEAVQNDFNEGLARQPDSDKAAIDSQLAGHDVHLKLRHEIAGMPYVASLIIFDSRGRAINFSRQWPAPDINVVDRDYFKALTRDPALTSFLGAPVRDSATGNWIMPLARKISGPNGELVGIISAGLELQYLQKFFSDISSEASGGVALFRNDGTLLARFPENNSDIGRRFPNVIAMKLVANSGHGVGISDGAIDHLHRMVAAHRVNGYPIIITATKTTAKIFADWQKTAAYIGLASILIIAAIAAFALLFTRLFRNYQALVQARAERNRAEQLREQSLRFDVALNNMSQGLVMFDAASKLVVVNSRFIEIYGVSADVVKPGLSLLDLLKHRKETGSFSGDPAEYHAKLLERIAQRKLSVQNVETPDGRIIKIMNQPMPDGGWVATHEDITEKVAAEDELRKQEEQLNAALENISQGVCMFDASQCLIICNKQYADLYGLTDEQTKPGTPLRAILDHRIARGNAPEDHETYIQQRLNEVSINQPYQTVNRLRNGRFVAVVHRPMANGGWVATHQDITEARHREESFRLLFEGNPVSMWVIDRQSLRFLAVNEAAIAHYGYSREQFMSMAVTDLRPVEDRALHEFHARPGGRPISGKYRTAQ